MTNAITNNLPKSGTFRISKEITVNYRKLIGNLLSAGLDNFNGYGFTIDYDDNVYSKTKEALLEKHTKVSFTYPNVYTVTLSWEDVLTEMILNGGEIIFTDIEGSGEYTSTLTLDKVEKALWRFLDEEPSDAFIMGLERIMEEEYDADDADVILQYIIFGEYTFS